ncbi:hypothetical protein EC991_003746 [Linnemannia zychae]|nr:hypothetical protein EC991_003746 [Linnemannia zychae]
MIVLSNAIDAAATLYARYSHDSYASSIRWSRIGGFRESIELLWNSRHVVPKRSSFVMAIIVLAGIFLLGASTLLGLFVSHAEKRVNPATYKSLTQQAVSTDLTFWTAFMGGTSTTEEILTLMFNDTRRIPTPAPRIRYTPRTYDYDTVCNEVGVSFLFDPNFMVAYPPQPPRCKEYIISLTNTHYDWNNTALVTDLIDPNIFMIKAPVILAHNPIVFQGPMTSFEGKERKSCGGFSIGRSLDLTYYPFPKDGVIWMPKTDASKCQFGSNESIVLSATYIHFAVNRLSDFGDVVASIFEDSINLSLLQSMNNVIKNGAFSTPNNITTLVTLIDISSTVDYLICIWSYLYSEGISGLLCTYIVTEMLSIKPQAWDPAMETDLNWTSTHSISPNDTTNKLNFTIYHIPKAPATNKPLSSFSAALLHNATTDVAKYLASLGHNGFVSKGTGAGTETAIATDRLYVLYDTIELKDAFEVPTRFFIFLSIFVAFCLALSTVSLVMYPTTFNGTLYRIIFEELKAKEDKTPMLMNNTDEPLAFEGQRVIPDQDDQPGDSFSTQGVPLLPLSNNSTHTSQAFDE